MFAHLTQKLTLPHATHSTTLAWHGTIAVATVTKKGEAQIRVLKLGGGEKEKLGGNQVLVGHSEVISTDRKRIGQITHATWNVQYQQLTTADESGLIIVWTSYKGMWYEEMVNAATTKVSGLHWNRDGTLIVIAYKDGTVVVGNQEGSRIWTKKFGSKPIDVQWSPDSKYLLIATTESDLQLYDSSGNMMTTITLQSSSSVMKMLWHPCNNDLPCLAILYHDGYIVLMTGERDPNPVAIDTGLKSIQADWSPDGAVIAITGVQDNINYCQFISQEGTHMRTLALPGSSPVSCLSWDGSASPGLKLGLCIENSLYFANVHRDYKWTYLRQSHVLVYTLKANEGDLTVFWDVKSNVIASRQFHRVLCICSHGEWCCLATMQEDKSIALDLCNAMGITMGSTTISFAPHMISMNSNTIVASNGTLLSYWLYPSAVTNNRFIKKTATPPVTVSIDEAVALGATGTDIPTVNVKPANTSINPIQCIACCKDRLIVARDSGAIHQISLPELALEAIYSIEMQPYSISINSDGTKAALVSSEGVLRIIHVQVLKLGRTESSESMVRLSDIDRKDVWGVKWSQDHPDLLAIAEKSKTYIIRGDDIEEPMSISGYLADFSDLEVRLVDLDSIVASAMRPKPESITIAETRSLRDTRSLLSVSIHDVAAFIEKNPHPRLWRLLTEHAMLNMNIEAALAIVSKCRDYPVIQFVKRVSALEDTALQSAEIMSFFSRYDEAEQTYLDNDRLDLAIRLQLRLGNASRVEHLLQASRTTDQNTLSSIYSELGDQLADAQNWEQAISYYAKSQDFLKRAQCYYQLEMFEGLQQLVDEIPSGHKCLKDVASLCKSVGLAQDAIKAYKKAGDLQSALDVGMYLNQWGLAIDLGHDLNSNVAEETLNNYANNLLLEEKYLTAIELYRKANYRAKSVELLMKIAQEEMARKSPALRIKKLYVLAALEERQHPSETITVASQKPSHHLEKLGTAWSWAQCFHFYILSQQLHYEGKHVNALKSALVLQRFESLLGIQTTYSLIAFMAYQCRYYESCSRAFIKLEAITSEFTPLAFQLFKDRPPVNPKLTNHPCPNCGSAMASLSSSCDICNKHFPTCVASGRTIFNPNDILECNVCHGVMLRDELGERESCPLCHHLL